MDNRVDSRRYSSWIVPIDVARMLYVRGFDGLLFYVWENVEIRFDNSLISYTVSGPGEIGDELCLLSFTEYSLQGFTAEKPIDYSKFVGKWGMFWSDDRKEYTISKLVSFKDGGFRSATSIMLYKNFKPLTDGQIKLLEI